MAPASEHLFKSWYIFGLYCVVFNRKPLFCGCEKKTAGSYHTFFKILLVGVGFEHWEVEAGKCDGWPP